MPEAAAAPAANPDTPPQKPSRQDNATDTVTVACKLPNGLTLRIYDMEPATELVMGGGVRETRRAVRLPGEYVLHGTATDAAAIRAGHYPEHQIVAGFALTPGVPRDFWEKWERDNRDAPVVRNGLICGFKSEGLARDAARERAGLRSGLEPLDPDNLPAQLRRVRRGTRQSADVDNL